MGLQALRRETRNFIGSPANQMKQDLESALKTRDAFKEQLLEAQAEMHRLQDELGQAGTPSPNLVPNPKPNPNPNPQPQPRS